MDFVVEKLIEKLRVDVPHGLGVGVDEPNPIEVRRHGGGEGHRLEAVLEGRAVLGLGAQLGLQLLEGRRSFEGAEGDAFIRREVARDVVMPDFKGDVGRPELLEGFDEASAIGFPAVRAEGRDDFSAHCDKRPLVRWSRSYRRG